MTTPNWEKAWGWLRHWRPVFLDRDGNQPLSLSSEYRSTLGGVRARRSGQRRTWRTGVSEHHEAVRTIVRSFLEQFRGLGWGHDPALFASERRGIEEQGLAPCDTTTPPHRTRTGVGLPRRRSRPMSYLLPSPWKPSRWSEKPSRGLLRASQNPNGVAGVGQDGIGCRCSQPRSCIVTPPAPSVGGVGGAS